MKSRELFKKPSVQAGVMVGAALVHTAWKDHRAKTHRSIELHPATDAAVDVLGGAFTDSTRWAAVHRVHHSTPDANLLPFIEYADLVTWLDEHPDLKAQYELPHEVHGIDPAVSSMTHEEVREIGNLGRQLVEGKYVPASDYMDEDIRRILYSDAPRYLYEASKGHKEAVPEIVGHEATLWDVRYLLRDPHSPALHPQGMRGIVRHNRMLYEDTVVFFTKNPQYMPDDLEFTPRERFIESHKKQVRLGMVATSMAWRVAAERPKNGRELAQSSVRGAVVAGIATAALIAGGNIVNSIGHGGKVKFSSREFTRDFWSGRVQPKDNGTYTTDNRLLSPPTLGEVGGQYEHHEDPSLIAYTHEKGVKKVMVDPFGAATEFLARHNIGMSVGPGFDGSRPDMPSEAVLKLEEVRRRYLQDSV